MQRSAEVIALMFMVITWIAGIVLASGFWQTLFSFFPFYAWYLVVEKFMRAMGWI